MIGEVDRCIYTHTLTHTHTHTHTHTLTLTHTHSHTHTAYMYYYFQPYPLFTKIDDSFADDLKKRFCGIQKVIIIMHSSLDIN